MLPIKPYVAGDSIEWIFGDDLRRGIVLMSTMDLARRDTVMKQEILDLVHDKIIPWQIAKYAKTIDVPPGRGMVLVFAFVKDGYQRYKHIGYRFVKQIYTRNLKHDINERWIRKFCRRGINHRPEGEEV